MVTNDYKVYIQDIITHSHGGSSHQTLVRTLAHNLKLSSVSSEFVDCCLKCCKDFEEQGLLTCYLLSDEHFYFSQNSNY